MSHKTMHDYVVALGGYSAIIDSGHPLSRRLVRQDGLSDRMFFVCECTRVVDTNMMLDLQPDTVPAIAQLTPAVRAAIGTMQRFRCDGCWTHWVRTSKIDKNVLRLATGQPSTTKVW